MLNTEADGGLELGAVPPLVFVVVGGSVVGEGVCGASAESAPATSASEIRGGPAEAVAESLGDRVGESGPM